MAEEASVGFQYEKWLSQAPPDEEVVITGISGRFPNSTNIEELRDNLFNKLDITSDITKRWIVDNPELPKKAGLLPDISSFDPGYFGLHYRQALNMDPVLRKFMEVTTEAIIDAGVHPSELAGSRTGVFVAHLCSEEAALILPATTEPHNLRMTGYTKSCLPNRISYYFKLKGPSIVLDSACNSSLSALEHAFRAIRTGKCDNAIVGGCNTILHPGQTLQFSRQGVLSAESTCRSFDENADGYVRSEAIVCLFLQKGKNSKRLYAQVVYVRSNNDGFKQEGIHFPSARMQAQLLKEIFETTGIHQSQLSYIELHGTGTKVGDTEEVCAVDTAVAKKRKKQLLIGSVKSNLGHTEVASGIVSIVKVLLAMQNGYIAPNINFNKIKSTLTGLIEGRMKVVTEATALEGKEALVGINNFGFGGTNSHVLLKRWSKEKKLSDDDVPRLVCISGRTEEAVLAIMNKKIFDIEYFGLLHHIFKKKFPEHFYRGYSILTKEKVIKTSSQIVVDQPLTWYINFGKLDNSFESLGKYFMSFPTFQATMLKINHILEDKNINIIDIISSRKKEIKYNILGSTSVQIGIFDTIQELDLRPVSIWKDSLGKLICAYCNKDMTLEEVIMKAVLFSEENITEGFCENGQSEPEKSFRETQPPTLSKIITKPEKSIIVLNISDIKNLTTFLEVIGRLYETGHNPQIHKLYKKLEFPVGNGTPMISPLIRWYYNKDWYTTIFTNLKQNNDTKKVIIINLTDERNKYIEGYVVDGRNVFPITGYLYLIWEFLVNESGKKTSYCPIIFENCRFVRATVMTPTTDVTFTISYQQETGNFEISENEIVVATGKAFVPKDIKTYQNDLPSIDLDETDPKKILTEDDIYKELNLRGYNYKGLFKGIVKCNLQASSGLVRWEDNFVTFMDKIFQMKIFQYDTRSLYVPTSIKKLTIDPIKHFDLIETEGKDGLFPVYVYRESDTIRSEGIEVCGLQISAVAKKKQLRVPVLQKHKFVPNETMINLTQSVRINIQIILEESMEHNVKALELIDEDVSSAIMPLINEALDDVPLVHPNLIISSKIPVKNISGVKIEEMALTSTQNQLLIVATKILQNPFLFQQVLNALSPTGFVLTREEQSFVPGHVEGITILTQHKIGSEMLILFQKTQIFENPKPIQISSENLDWISHLQKSLKTQKSIILYCQNQQTEGLLGFINCIRREPGGNKVKCFFIMDQAPKFDPAEPFYKQQIMKNRAINIYRDATWGTYRHLLLEEVSDHFKEHSFVSMTSRGDLSSVKWIEGPLSSNDKNPNIVQTYYSAVNFKDVMTASGRIPALVDRMFQDSIEGNEFSGRDSSGNRIMGMVSNGGLSTLIAADPILSWPVPDSWSLEEAATVPVVYSTVLYTLLMRASLKSGTSILIHSATGAVGIAALNVALFHKCKIFVTVGTQEKRNYLRTNFPEIPNNHIGNSRDTSFEQLIKKQTEGRGVDIVLNSLSEEKLNSSVRCLSRGGQFMEIGKFDSINNSSLELLLFEKEASYHGIMLDEIFKGHAKLKCMITEIVSKGIKHGYVKPIVSTIFEREKVETAFRNMTRGHHIGKILIKIRDEEKEKIIVPSPRSVLAHPRFYCDPEKTYIIVGGLGGFGLELVDWLVLRGAKKLILSSRSGVQTGYQSGRIKVWESYGTAVHISTCDITTKNGCLDLIQTSNQIGGVDGIFNLALVLQDALFENQTIENFKICLAPKADATKHLDEISRDQCPSLKYFVVFSSVSCGRGNPGQTNYGMTNSIMERICEKRKKDGYSALAIQWGAIGDVGFVAKMQTDNRVIGGTLQQKISSCLSVMDQFLKQDNAVVSSMVVAEKCVRNSASAVDAVAAVLGIKNLASVRHQSTLTELGIDSIMVTEVKQILETQFEIYVAAKDIRTLNLSKIRELESEKNSNNKDKNMKKFAEITNSVLHYMDGDSDDGPVVVKLPNKLKENQPTSTVLVLCGIEGNLKMLEPLTKNINANLLGVKYNQMNPASTIEEMALALLPHVEKQITNTKQFSIICYSFGVIVGLELVSLLEERGYVGKVAAIDGSPSYVAKYIQKHGFGNTEAEFQTSFLYAVYGRFLPIEILSRYKDKLIQCSNFDERLDMIISLRPSEFSNNIITRKEVSFKVFERYKATLNYRFEHKKIKSEVTLYKATFPMIADIEQDYNLGKMCETLHVKDIEGTHVTMLEQNDLLVGINKNFEKTVEYV